MAILGGGGATGTFGETLGGGGVYPFFAETLGGGSADGIFDATVGGGGAVGTFSDTLGGGGVYTYEEFGETLGGGEAILIFYFSPDSSLPLGYVDEAELTRRGVVSVSNVDTLFFNSPVNLTRSVEITQQDTILPASVSEFVIDRVVVFPGTDEQAVSFGTLPTLSHKYVLGVDNKAAFIGSSSFDLTRHVSVSQTDSYSFFYYDEIDLVRICVFYSPNANAYASTTDSTLQRIVPILSDGVLSYGFLDEAGLNRIVALSPDETLAISFNTIGEAVTTQSSLVRIAVVAPDNSLSAIDGTAMALTRFVMMVPTSSSSAFFTSYTDLIRRVRTAASDSLSLGYITTSELYENQSIGAVPNVYALHYDTSPDFFRRTIPIAIDRKSSLLKYSKIDLSRRVLFSSEDLNGTASADASQLWEKVGYSASSPKATLSVSDITSLDRVVSWVIQEYNTVAVISDIIAFGRVIPFGIDSRLFPLSFSVIRLNSDIAVGYMSASMSSRGPSANLEPRSPNMGVGATQPSLRVKERVPYVLLDPRIPDIELDSVAPYTTLSERAPKILFQSRRE